MSASCIRFKCFSTLSIFSANFILLGSTPFFSASFLKLFFEKLENNKNYDDLQKYYNEGIFIDGINDENILNELISSYQRRYLNYIPTRYNSIGQEGSMLIISPSEYFNELAPFIEWKRQSGREVVLVDIADIVFVVAEVFEL